MATIKNTEDHDFEWCDTCLMLHANGEVGDYGDLPEWMERDEDGAHLYNWPGDDQSENAATRHAAKMDAQWSWTDGWHVAANCPEDCCESFSWFRCDGCGSRLGGSRHPAVAWREISSK